MMMAFLHRRLGAVLLAMACSASVQAAAFDGMVDVGAHKLHVVTMGEGPYTVVFESSFGSDLSAWRKVAPEVAKKASVLVYSRAGTGQSPARGVGVPLEQAAAEFKQVLAATGAKGPLILVGHSYGAFLIRAFAARHPEQVAGMVFVDPADEGIEPALAALDAARVQADRRSLAQMVPPAMQEDLRLVQAIMAGGQLPVKSALPDVPAAMLTSVRADPKSPFFIETPAAVKLKRERHAAFFAQFSSGAHVVTPNSGHNIPMQEPELVVGAVEQVLASALKQAQRRAQQLAKETLMGELARAGTLLAAGEARNAEALVAKAAAASGLAEAQLNTLGFDVMNKGKQPALAALLLHYNAHTFTQSHNAADSYGEALLALNRAAEARLQFDRAIALARAGQASPRTLAAYQANADKAAKAVN
jgi:pimeloyl-ACP methyl ester carboxylesterase